VIGEGITHRGVQLRLRASRVVVRLDPGTDPEAWILSAHPHAAAVMALDYLVSGCTEVYSSI